jgi:PKD repeat protein
MWFNDTSTNTPTSWNWSFGDGTYSDAQNPVKTYRRPGLMTITFNATNAAGTSTATSRVWVTAGGYQLGTPFTSTSDYYDCENGRISVSRALPDWELAAVQERVWQLCQ